jgi:N-acetyl-gamma-glutamylphosphate reductase
VSQAVPRRYQTTEIADLSADRRFQSVQDVTRGVWEKWWETGCNTGGPTAGSKLSCAEVPRQTPTRRTWRSSRTACWGCPPQVESSSVRPIVSYPGQGG